MKLDNILRDDLFFGVYELSADQQYVFKLMYSCDHMGRTISEVVDRIPSNELDHAYQQFLASNEYAVEYMNKWLEIYKSLGVNYE